MSQNPFDFPSGTTAHPLTRFPLVSLVLQTRVCTYSVLLLTIDLVYTAIAGFPPDVYHHDFRQGIMATTAHPFAFYNYDIVMKFCLQVVGLNFSLFFFRSLASGGGREKLTRWSSC